MNNRVGEVQYFILPTGMYAVRLQNGALYSIVMVPGVHLHRPGVNTDTTATTHTGPMRIETLRRAYGSRPAAIRKRIQGRGPEPRDESTSRGMGLEPSVDVSFTSGRASRRQRPDLALPVLQILITPSIY